MSVVVINSIFVAIWLITFVAIIVYEVAKQDAIKDCRHEFRAFYQSKGIEQCIDCLEEMPIKKVIKIQHQRG